MQKASMLLSLSNLKWVLEQRSLFLEPFNSGGWQGLRCSGTARAPAPPAADPLQGGTQSSLGVCSFSPSLKTPELHGEEQEGQKENFNKKTADGHYFLTVFQLISYSLLKARRLEKAENSSLYAYTCRPHQLFLLLQNILASLQVSTFMAVPKYRAENPAEHSQAEKPEARREGCYGQPWHRVLPVPPAPSGFFIHYPDLWMKTEKYPRQSQLKGTTAGRLELCPALLQPLSLPEEERRTVTCLASRHEHRLPPGPILRYPPGGRAKSLCWLQRIFLLPELGHA